MKRLLVIAVVLFGLVSAQGTQNAEDKTYYEMFQKTSGGYVLIQCYDWQDAYPDPAAVKREIVGIFDTDLVLVCVAYAQIGEPSVYAHLFNYVADGVNYEFPYSDFAEIEGNTGKLREGSEISFLLTPRNAQRGEPFTLYYEDDKVEIELRELEY